MTAAATKLTDVTSKIDSSAMEYEDYRRMMPVMNRADAVQKRIEASAFSKRIQDLVESKMYKDMF